MLKKLKRRIKEKLERLPDKNIKVIQAAASIIKLLDAILYAVFCLVLLGLGALFVVGLIGLGYINGVVAIGIIVILIIISLINFYAQKVNMICDKVILDRNIDPEIKTLQDNLSKDEYTKIIRIDERWEVYINGLKTLLEWLESPEMEYNAKLVGNNNIEIVVKNKEGECKDRIIVDSNTFLEFYKIPDTECK